jgi:hypothetical protein
VSEVKNDADDEKATPKRVLTNWRAPPKIRLLILEARDWRKDHKIRELKYMFEEVKLVGLVKEAEDCGYATILNNCHPPFPVSYKVKRAGIIPQLISSLV